ncbi:flavodoxin family protein [Mumia sp. ZJ430]|uniref:flavodoxin family protein n=1 Tax=Mumia sp. ZJ430 TaxID=2708083 RepID=UPI00141D820F|nr:flavodoxin family protein [Mumia sp. ZJ430]
MARVQVVYESIWGNTEAIARAIGEGIAVRLGNDAVTIEEASPQVTLDPDIELLVVGGPTHAFGMSKAATRRSAQTAARPSTRSPSRRPRRRSSALSTELAACVPQ